MVTAPALDVLEVQDGEQLVLWLHSTTQTMQVSVLSAEQAAEQAATPDAMQEDTEEYCVVAASADPPPSPGALPAAEPVLPPAPCWRAAQAMMQERRRSGEAPETWRRWCAALRCLLHRLQLDSPSLRYPSDHSSSGGGGAPVLDRCSPLAKGVVFSSQMVDVAMRLNGVELTKAVSVATVPAHFPPSWHAVASGEVPAGAAEQHLGPVPESPPLHPQGAGWPHEEAYRSLSAPTMRSLDRGDSAPAAADAAAATAPAAPAGPMPEVACSLVEARCRGRCTLLGPADAEQLRQLLTMPVAEVAALAQRLGRPGASYAATATGQGKLLLASSASSPAERRSRSVVHRWAAAEGGAAAALPSPGSCTCSEVRQGGSVSGKTKASCESRRVPCSGWSASRPRHSSVKVAAAPPAAPTATRSSSTTTPPSVRVVRAAERPAARRAWSKRRCAAAAGRTVWRLTRTFPSPSSRRTVSATASGGGGANGSAGPSGAHAVGRLPGGRRRVWPDSLRHRWPSYTTSAPAA